MSDPFPLLRGAKFFVMTSRFEGTPNALLEAMACGLPAVVSDASPGPCELIGADEERRRLDRARRGRGRHGRRHHTSWRATRLCAGVLGSRRANAHAPTTLHHAIDVWLRPLALRVRLCGLRS